VADNPDGAHMRGLNANMIDSIENEDATGAHRAAPHEHEPGQSMTEDEYAETNVSWSIRLQFNSLKCFFRWTSKYSLLPFPLFILKIKQTRQL
jgi:hypothetical protein